MMTPQETYAICGYSLSPGHFSSQDWFTCNAIDASGRLIASFLNPVFYLSNAGRLFEIPANEPTDYASTPPETWGAPLFLIPYGWWSLPAGGHDAAFKNLLMERFADGTRQLANLSESDSNSMLLEMMQSIKPTPTLFEKAQMDAIYEGLMIGGWHAYKEDRS